MSGLRRAGVTLAGGLAGVAVHTMVIGPLRFAVRHERLALPRWRVEHEGLRIALVSDVHVGAPWMTPRRVRRIVDVVRDQRTDLVLLLGDYPADVGLGRALEPARVAAALAGLQEAPAPVVAILGNHDWYAGGHRIRAALESAGFPVLEESAVGLRLRGAELWLAGVGDLWERTPSVPAALAGVPLSAPVLLLTHNPDVIIDVPHRVALTVAGHTHAGQVTLFGRPLHRVSPYTGNRYLRGWYDVGGRPLYVSAGLGTSVIPLRTVIPEVVVLTLVRGDPSACTPAGRVLNLV